jgi:hypothetical protein
MSETTTLIPATQSHIEGMKAVWVTLEQGEYATLSMEGLQLVLGNHKLWSDGFNIRKDGASEAPAKPDCLTEEWNLGVAKTPLKASSATNGILLGPSFLGETLYGGDLHLGGDSMRHRYGLLRPEFDEEDGIWGVSIFMPDEPYGSMTRLTLIERSIK